MSEATQTYFHVGTGSKKTDNGFYVYVSVESTKIIENLPAQLTET